MCSTSESALDHAIYLLMHFNELFYDFVTTALSHLKEEPVTPKLFLHIFILILRFGTQKLWFHETSDRDTQNTCASKD